MRITVVVPVPTRCSRGQYDWGRTDEEAKAVLIDVFSLLRALPKGQALEQAPKSTGTYPQALPLKGIAILPQGYRPWFEASCSEQHARTIGACIPTLEYIGLRRKAEAYWDND